MHRHPFLALLGINVAVILSAFPYGSALAAAATALLTPVALGLLSARSSDPRRVDTRLLHLAVAIGVGALIRPYWWAAMTDHDFTFDNEPEVEFEVAFIQFFVAGFSFLFGWIFRRSLPFELVRPPAGSSPETGSRSQL